VYRRSARPRILGAATAFLALCLQIAAAGLYLPLPMAAAARGDAELARLYDAHALCIAAKGGAPSSTAPEDKAPTPPTHHLGACCPGHGSVSPYLPLPAAVEPILFAYTGISFLAAATVIVAARLPGTPRARAPPAVA
jgi:hypothetical protein